MKNNKPIIKKEKQIIKNNKKITKDGENSCPDHIPSEVIAEVKQLLQQIQAITLPYVHLMDAHDQWRAKGITMNNVGFIKESIEIAKDNPEFVSSYLNLPKYESEIALFDEGNEILSEIGVINAEWKQIVRWSAIKAFREYQILYGYIREMADKNIPTAEALYKEMSKMYEKRKGKHNKKDEGIEEIEVEFETKAKEFIVDKKEHLTQDDLHKVMKYLPKK